MVVAQPDPRPYELMTVLVPELGDDDLNGQIETINGQITAVGGEVSETLRESPWGRRRLAYTIRHNGQDFRDGYYVVTHFTLPPSRTTDLERDLKLNVQVMRYLLVHDDPKAGERGRDPELIVDHSEDPQAPSPVVGVAQTGVTGREVGVTDLTAPAATESPSTLPEVPEATENPDDSVEPDVDTPADEAVGEGDPGETKVQEEATTPPNGNQPESVALADEAADRAMPAPDEEAASLVESSSTTEESERKEGEES